MRYLAYSYFVDHYIWVDAEEFDFNPSLSETGFNESQARESVACEKQVYPDRWEMSEISRMVAEADRFDREGDACL